MNERNVVDLRWPSVKFGCESRMSEYSGLSWPHVYIDITRYVVYRQQRAHNHDTWLCNECVFANDSHARTQTTMRNARCVWIPSWVHIAVHKMPRERRSRTSRSRSDSEECDASVEPMWIQIQNKHSTFPWMRSTLLGPTRFVYGSNIESPIMIAMMTVHISNAANLTRWRRSYTDEQTTKTRTFTTRLQLRSRLPIVCVEQRCRRTEQYRTRRTFESNCEPASWHDRHIESGAMCNDGVRSTVSLDRRRTRMI